MQLFGLQKYEKITKRVICQNFHTMTQSNAIIETIDRLGGVATLNQIYQHIFEIKDCKWGSKTPLNSIRYYVRHTDGIYRIKPGLYALESHRQTLERSGIIVQDEKNKDSDEVKQFNHSYYQGLLLEIGNLHNYSTFVPEQDKGKMFLTKPLGSVRSLQAIPRFSYDRLVKRSSTIDVIWFNENQMPHSFFEVEHSTDIKNSLLKFYDLQDFYVRMVIVADEKRRQEFLNILSFDAFHRLKKEKRVAFLSYESLEKQYEQDLQRVDLEFLL